LWCQLEEDTTLLLKTAGQEMSTGKGGRETDEVSHNRHNPIVGRTRVDLDSRDIALRDLNVIIFILKGDSSKETRDGRAGLLKRAGILLVTLQFTARWCRCFARKPHLTVGLVRERRRTEESNLWLRASYWSPVIVGDFVLHLPNDVISEAIED
jgi:hypothetical protein